MALSKPSSIQPAHVAIKTRYGRATATATPTELDISSPESTVRRVFGYRGLCYVDNVIDDARPRLHEAHLIGTARERRFTTSSRPDAPAPPALRCCPATPSAIPLPAASRRARRPESVRPDR